MTDMIERVAKAIAEHGGSNWDSCLKAPGQRMAGMYRAMARAAIEAMREPTPEVLKGMWRRNDDNDSEQATLANWQDAIDAALGHPRTP